MPNAINVNIVKSAVARNITLNYIRGNVVLNIPLKSIPSITFTKSGSTGLSAYDIAVSRGFVGTIDEWLTSLSVSSGMYMNALHTSVANTPSIGLSENFICFVSDVVGKKIKKVKYSSASSQNGGGLVCRMAVYRSGSFFANVFNGTVAQGSSYVEVAGEHIIDASDIIFIEVVDLPVTPGYGLSVQLKIE